MGGTVSGLHRRTTADGPSGVARDELNQCASRTFTLVACSPAVDAGSNTFPGSTFEWDQRGDPFVRELGAAPDIGVFELQPNGDVIFRNGFEASPCP